MAFKFQGIDFIQFDSLLSDDELIVRASTRAFVEDNLIPIIEQCNRDGRFPRELVLPMGKLGFYGATLEGYEREATGLTASLRKAVNEALTR